MKAADGMCRVMQRFRVGDAAARVPGLSEEMKGTFGFPPVKLTYKAKGVGSWKYEALQAHRFDVVRVILPRYGICVA